jgi:hypothetical protein
MGEQARPAFTGLVVHHDPTFGYALLIPAGWQRLSLSGSGSGVFYAPDANGLITGLAVDAVDLGTPVVASDLATLQRGMLVGLRRLPHCQIESSEADCAGQLLTLESHVSRRTRNPQALDAAPLPGTDASATRGTGCERGQVRVLGAHVLRSAADRPLWQRLVDLRRTRLLAVFYSSTSSLEGSPHEAMRPDTIFLHGVGRKRRRQPAHRLSWSPPHTRGHRTSRRIGRRTFTCIAAHYR